MFRFLTSGESHGQALLTILEGLPAGLEIDVDFVNTDLRRRQFGFGRGERMKIEQDQVEILAGVRHGKTLGSPISLLIRNKDWENWKEVLAVAAPVEAAGTGKSVTRPRPGHADLAGILKYGHQDVRNVLERASARETVARVAVGAFCKLFLRHFGVGIASHVASIGTISISEQAAEKSYDELLRGDGNSQLRCLDPVAEQKMIELIIRAKETGDSLGGVFEVVVAGLPPGLGSFIQWDKKLDGLLAQALLSIQAVKAVEIGDGVKAAASFGSQVHDEVFYDSQEGEFFRRTNRAGGLEGGMTNGQELRVRAYLKPISTLRRPLKSVDIGSKESSEAAYERSDVCVVPAAGVIGEAMVAIVLTGAFLEKFGGDSLRETERNFNGYMAQVKEFSRK
ncbi:MAG: chorismate synthase [Acidobacteria bacterium]|nr:chorismate synthase [Acidobacteriota bacterium]